MPGRIFVTGGSGFVGSHVIEELASRGRGINALVNRRPVTVGGEHVRSIEGDLANPEALDAVMHDCDSAVHIVGIIAERPGKGVTFERIHVEGTRQVVEAAQRNGLRRIIHMSALGARPGAVSDYHKTKYRAEQIVRSSGLDWTIFRPSVIHGTRGEFIAMLAGWARRRQAPFLFMPYFGAGLFGTRGAGRLQPVYVKDVARAFADALSNPRTIGEVYPLAGPDEMTWPEMHRTAASVIVGKRRWVMAVPVWYARCLTALLPRFMLPFNRDQVIMSQEDNTADVTKFKGDFGWDPQPFEPTLRSYANQL